MEKKKKNPLIQILLFRNIVGGLFGSLTHVLILSIAESFGLSTSELGGLLSANYVASIVMPLLAGRLGDLFGKKRVVIASMIVSIIGSILVIVSPTAEIYVIGIIIGGLGGSAENSVLTPAVADTYPEKAARYISWMQVFGSVSGIVSPLIVNYFNLTLGLGWRQIKLISLLILLIPYVTLFFIKIDARKEGKTARGLKEVLKLLSDPALVLGAVTMLFYCATDNTYSNFVSIYYQERFGSLTSGALALTLNSAMYAFSRFMMGLIKKNRKRIAAVSLLISAAAMLLLAFAKDETVALIFGTIYSLTFAPAYPLVISDAAVNYPGNSATATSLMFMAAGVGCMLITTPASLIAGTKGVGTLFIILSATSIVSMVLYMLYVNANNRKNRKESDEEGQKD